METATDVKTDAVQSAEIEKVAAALVAAQGEMTNPPKTKTVHAGQKKYSFAPLPEIIDAVRPVLTKHGLAVVQLVRERMLETRLIHTSGQWIGAAYTLPSLADSQDMGSAITYARRYSLCAILGIAGEDDEDGEAATAAEQAEAEARRKEAEMRLNAMKAKGQMKSAYDGKVLAPGESPLPAQRAAGGKREAGGGEGQDPEVRSQKPEGKTAAGPAAHAVPGEKDKATLTPALSPPMEREKSAARSAPPTLKNGKGEDALAGMAKPLAALMKKEGITPEELQAYYTVKGHFPVVVEPTALPPDYVAKLMLPENWTLAVAAIKGGSK
jgi:hypothetical protein